MNRKANPDWEWEKKPRKVEKGTDKAGKHRKSIYNMLSDEDDEFDSAEGDVHYYNSNSHYDKKRR